jgi:hypothetical protein
MTELSGCDRVAAAQRRHAGGRCVSMGEHDVPTLTAYALLRWALQDDP